MSLKRCLFASCVMLALAGWPAPDALADAVAVNTPSGTTAVVASGSRWAVLASSGVETSDDGGDSWQVPSGQSGPTSVSVAPDGAIWAGGPELIRLAPGSLAFAPTSLTAPQGSTITAVSAPDWSSSGQQEVAAVLRDGAGSSSLTVATVDSSGDLLPGPSVSLASQVGCASPSLRLVGGFAVVGCSPAGFQPGAGYTTVGGDLKLSYWAPVWASGQDLMGSGGQLSYDGGQNVTGADIQGLVGVQQAPDLIVELNSASATMLMSEVRRYTGAGEFTDTGLMIPNVVQQAAATPRGILALSHPQLSSATQLYLDGDAPIGIDGSTGPTTSADQSMVARLNEYRTTLGVEPVLSDAAINQAATNHSRYWTLNAHPSNPLELHSETSGNPGFTGAGPFDRCAVVNVTCTGEVMVDPALGDGATTVDGRMDTLLHRDQILSPDVTRVGGDIYGHGPAVMDAFDDPLSLKFVGYPSGPYGGPLTFFGEYPNPVDQCAQAGEPVSNHPGTPISLYPPTGTAVLGFALTTNGTPVPGCGPDDVLGGFLPDRPLAPNTTYTATAEYGVGNFSQVVTWTFTTGAGGGVGTTTTPPSASPRRGPRVYILTTRAVLKRKRIAILLRCAGARAAVCRGVVKLTGVLAERVKRGRQLRLLHRAVATVPAQYQLKSETESRVDLRFGSGVLARLAQTRKHSWRLRATATMRRGVTESRMILVREAGRRARH